MNSFFDVESETIFRLTAYQRKVVYSDVSESSSHGGGWGNWRYGVTRPNLDGAKANFSCVTTLCL
jgi:hypothetical protein